MKVKFVVAYDGTDFSGWATQTGRRTVQGTLTEAVRHISGEENEIWGASRTDGGAHAAGQVCHFDTDCRVPVDRWPRILRAILPYDVAVVSSREVPDWFHSRFSVDFRHYRYRIQTGDYDPLRGRFIYPYGRPLQLDLMQRAASELAGRHDFRAFTEELEPHVQNTVRELYRFEVKQVRDEVWVDVYGTAFMRGMMRRMAGCLFEIGTGRRNIAEVSQLLDPQERHHLQWPVVLPAKGLCLREVRYARKRTDHRIAKEILES